MGYCDPDAPAEGLGQFRALRSRGVPRERTAKQRRKGARRRRKRARRLLKSQAGLAVVMRLRERVRAGTATGRQRRLVTAIQSARRGLAMRGVKTAETRPAVVARGPRAEPPPTDAPRRRRLAPPPTHAPPPPAVDGAAPPAIPIEGPPVTDRGPARRPRLELTRRLLEQRAEAEVETGREARPRPRYGPSTYGGSPIYRGPAEPQYGDAEELEEAPADGLPAWLIPAAIAAATFLL